MNFYHDIRVKNLVRIKTQRFKTWVELANLLGKKQSQISEVIKGNVREFTEAFAREIEEKLNLAPGELDKDFSKPPKKNHKLNIDKSINIINHIIEDRYITLNEFCIAHGENFEYMKDILSGIHPTRKLTPGKIIDIEEKLGLPVGFILFPD